MNSKPSILKYTKLVKKIVQETILRDTRLMLTVIFTVVLNFVAAYYTVMATLAFSNLANNFNTVKFFDILKDFLRISMIAAIVDYVPSAVFTYYLQVIWRRRFVISLREALHLNHRNFNSKTPGEIQYGIFLKTQALPFCFNLIVDRLTSLMGSILFGFIKIKDNINFTIALAFSAVPLIYSIGIVVYINYKIKYHFNLLAEQEKTGKSLSDKLLNYELIKGYNNEEIEVSEFENVLIGQARAGVQMGRYESFSRWILTFILNIPFVLILFLMSLFTSGNHKSNLVNFTLLYTTQSTKIKNLSWNLDVVMECLNQIYYLNVENDVIQESKYEKIRFSESFEIKNWSVYYGSNKIIDNINLKINNGEKVAIVGKNGTGKSTLLKSLLGFARSTGEFYIDKMNIRPFPNKEIIKNISYISQDDFTSDDTVINNILLGLNMRMEDVDVYEKEMVLKRVRLVAKKFNIDDTFMNLKNGYFTKAGSRGSNLSSGERQKIAILRAYLKNAPIFIFDEATSVLDKKYESELVKLILKNLKNKVVIMIVHGTDLLNLFDKLIFIDNKKIAGVGDYKSLMDTNNEFKSLYK